MICDGFCSRVHGVCVCGLPVRICFVTPLQRRGRQVEGCRAACLFVDMAKSRNVCSWCSLLLSGVGVLARGGLGYFMGSAACIVVIMSLGSTPMTWVACLGIYVRWTLAGFTWLGTVAWLTLDPLIGVVCPRSWFSRVGMSSEYASR